MGVRNGIGGVERRARCCAMCTECGMVYRKVGTSICATHSVVQITQHSSAEGAVSRLCEGVVCCESGVEEKVLGVRGGLKRERREVSMKNECSIKHTATWPCVVKLAHHHAHNQRKELAYPINPVLMSIRNFFSPFQPKNLSENSRRVARKIRKFAERLFASFISLSLGSNEEQQRILYIGLFIL